MHSQTAGLLLLCITLNRALCCDWLRHYAHLSRKTLDLLDQMGGPLTEQESPIDFPYRHYTDIRKTKVETQLLFIKNSLKLISGLYHHGNLSSVSWDTEKTEKFLSNIHRQTVELNSCVPTKRTPNSQLRQYYRRLRRKTLYHTGGGTAYWELIRKETKDHLERLELLVASIRAASRGRTVLI